MVVLEESFSDDSWSSWYEGNGVGEELVQSWLK